MSKNQAILAAESERAHYVAQSALCALAGVSVIALGWAAWHGEFSSGAKAGTVVKAEPTQPVPAQLATTPVIPAEVPQTLPPLPPAPTPEQIAASLATTAPASVPAPVPEMSVPEEPKLMPAGGPVPTVPVGREISNPQVKDMVEAARAVRRRGDMQAALESLRVADLREKNHPEILSEIAMTYEAMGIADKADTAWKSVYALGEAGAGGYYALAKSKLDGREDAAKAAPRNAVTIGACQILPDKSVTKGQRLTLRVPIIAAAGAEIDPTQMDIHVYFYDKVGTDRIEPSKADAPAQNWASAPVDWKDEGREELLDVVYNMPELRPDEVRDLGKRAFYGYVVKLFYQNRLMGEQAEPRALLDYKPAVLAPPGATNALFPKN